MHDFTSYNFTKVILAQLGTYTRALRYQLLIELGNDFDLRSYSSVENVIMQLYSSKRVIFILFLISIFASPSQSDFELEKHYSVHTAFSRSFAHAHYSAVCNFAHAS